MNMFDEAKSISKMLTVRDMTQMKLAEILGVSQPYIANKLRLLNFSDELQRKITESGISERHARTLLRLDKEDCEEAIRKIKEGKMNVSQTEIMVDCMLEEKEARTSVGINFAERIGRFEDVLEVSLSNLRSFGIGAKTKKESFDGKLYINICIG
jgi:ParB family chromosome partitioning protein